jgi:hypothetical protein
MGGNTRKEFVFINKVTNSKWKSSRWVIFRLLTAEMKVGKIVLNDEEAASKK